MGIVSRKLSKIKFSIIKILMKKLFCLSLVLLSFLALFLRFGLQPTLEALGYPAKAGLRVTSLPEARVFLDGVEAGKTPFQDENLKTGEYKIELKAGEEHDLSQPSWKGLVKLTPGTLSAVNRELSSGAASSSGEMLALNRGKGATLTSNPAGAEVDIDGKTYGKTPLAIADLDPGEHTFSLAHPGYFRRNIRAFVPANLSLSLAVDLAISEADFGTLVSNTPLQKVVVIKTPTGFLRVRDKPSTLGREIARVVPGDELALLEEFSAWLKVKLEDGKEGYVSSTYAQKISQSPLITPLNNK